MGILSRSDEPTPPAVALTVEQFQTLVGLIKERASESGDDKATAAMTLALKTLDELKEGVNRTVIRNNAVGNGLSVFTIREGCPECDLGMKHEATGEFAHAKPDMKFEAYQCGVRMRADSLTVLEVELLNQFEGRGNLEARNGKWKAVQDRSGTTPRLLITYPASDIMAVGGDIPALTLLLMELLHGKASVDPLNLAAEVEKLRDQIAQLTKNQKAMVAA